MPTEDSNPTDPTDDRAAEPAAGDGHEGGRRRAAQDEVIIGALAAGLSYGDAGAAAGVTSRTVGRRMSDPAFAAQVSQRRGERVSQITGALTTMSDDALEVLRETMVEGSVSERLRAAQLTLTLMAKFRSETEMEQRLAAIERQLAAGAASAVEVTR